MRADAKAILEGLLRRAVGNPRRMRGRRLILAYHNIVPDGEEGLGDQSLHLPVSRFLQQIDALERHCRIRALTELLQVGPSSDRPEIAITFDDAYSGAVGLALPELSRRGHPSALFVAPGLLGSRSFWWDELAESPGGLSAERRRDALEQEAGRYDRIRSRWGRPGLADRLPASYGCATELEVRAAGANPHVTLGAHSWNHPNLVRLDEAELEEELTSPLAWLATLASPIERMLAYPYGLSARFVEAAVARVGYRAALRIGGGWLPSTHREPWAVRRLNVPAGLSLDGFLLRLSGIIAA